MYHLIQLKFNLQRWPMLLFRNSCEIHKRSNYNKSSYSTFSESSSTDDNSSVSGRSAKLPTSCEISAVTSPQKLSISKPWFPAQIWIDYQFPRLSHSHELDSGHLKQISQHWVMERKSLSAFLVLLLVCSCTGQVYVPHSPCPDLFGYFISQTYDIFGAMTLKNDLSGEYHLRVNMSIPTNTDKVS